MILKNQSRLDDELSPPKKSKNSLCKIALVFCIIYFCRLEQLWTTWNEKLPKIAKNHLNIS